ncbi:hypothetical protein [Mariniflexile sp.]|uniref:hypothetical protein n=1 Tax=Mariniflexile sp. TaxID=1979402 RepID=UPI003568BFC9
MENKRTFLILAFTLPFFTFSQNAYLDFGIDKNHDTIYGTIRNFISKRAVLYEKNTNPDEDRIKFRSHRLQKFKKIRFNDKIYVYVEPPKTDGIYTTERNRIITKDSTAITLGDFINIEKRLPDYIVTKLNDTIYGEIKDPALGKLHLLDASNTKINIDKDSIKSYRLNNEIYIHKEKRKATIFDKNGAYLKLVLDGKVRLHEYEHHSKFFNFQTNQYEGRSITYFYIEKGQEILLLGEFLHKKKLAELFSENQNLVSKILNEEYIIDNMYLIVKYFNENE